MQNSKEMECYHCLLPIKGDPPFTIEIDHKPRAMCCAGCKAVAQMIVDANLTQYYAQRTVGAIRPDSIESLVPEELRQEMRFYDDPEIAKQFISSNEIEGKTYQNAYLIIDNIVCAACVWLLEQGIQRIKGVKRFDVNYTTHRAHLVFDDTEVKISEVLLKIAELGYQGSPYDERAQEKAINKERNSLYISFGIAALCSMFVMTMAVGMYLGTAADQGMTPGALVMLRFSSLMATIPVATYCSMGFYRSAYYDLKNKRLSMNVNVSLAIIIAFVWSMWNTLQGTGETYYESVTMFAFLLLGARVLEMNSRHKALLISDHILKLKPHFAERIISDSQTEKVPINRINVGDVLFIKPGDSIPLDGILLEPLAMVDESLLTGESLPLEKREGDTLIGGSVNYEQSLTMRVTEVGANTVLSKMSRLIDRAMSEKPKIALLADLISTWFVLGVIATCVGTFLVWYFFVESSRAMEVTLSVLVITCPCALALATPSALSIGNQAIIEEGLIATRGGALSTLGKITDIVFDKTGTLTEGHLTINQVVIMADCDHTEDELLQIAISLESYSNHPIASGFKRLAKERGIERLEALDVENVIGVGITGVLSGDLYKIGRLDWFTDIEEGTFDDGLWIGLGKGKTLHAAFSLLDTIKDDTVEVVQHLKDSGYQLHILSGDRTATVKHFNEALKIEHVYGDLRPEDKLKYVEDLQKNGAIVAMLGDGINDGPVLAKADVSIAIGQGALIAQSTADMILMKDRKLMPLVEGIRLAKQTDKIIKQNLTWALMYNIIALPVAMIGFIVPWMAALGMSMSSVLVVGNTTRIRDGHDE